jgi:hypothetical protein
MSTASPCPAGLPVSSTQAPLESNFGFRMIFPFSSRDPAQVSNVHTNVIGSPALKLPVGSGCNLIKKENPC